MSQQFHKNGKDTSYGRVFRHENGLVCIYLADGVSLNLQKAQTLVEDVRAIDNSGKARLLVVQGVDNDLSFEAQRFLGTTKGLTHLALVVHSRFQTEVAQIFVKLINLLNSSYEMRVFHREKEAETWLLSKS
ncbi:MAG: STAS/SEC14 domain-containing protein [Ardenticatenaceae bacterium]|nr:STAS/SEC14 domain-containing protein [Anaerolineales bacterium]MCB8938905.1 STAS/SEC14 domain-containing protein [Ardenticatenaceae bacterium]MCB8974661.1 STAS/SEC14 domain-containing protein [Ardenticatenaceae bacterium]